MIYVYKIVHLPMLFSEFWLVLSIFRINKIFILKLYLIYCVTLSPRLDMTFAVLNESSCDTLTFSMEEGGSWSSSGSSSRFLQCPLPLWCYTAGWKSEVLPCMLLSGFFNSGGFCDSFLQKLRFFTCVLFSCPGDLITL